MSPTGLRLERAQPWKDGDIEGMLELYHEDVVMTPSPDWLETVQLKGKDAFRKNTEEWIGTWGAGGVLAHGGVVMTPSPDWRETVQLKGKDAFRKNTEEWIGTWGSVELETGEVETFGDRVVAHGHWRTTGRMSGLEGRMPIPMVFTVRAGRIGHPE